MPELQETVTNYADFIDSIFGAGSCPPKSLTKKISPILLQLEHEPAFRERLRQRLTKLQNVYPAGKSRNSVLRAVHLLASEKNWIGAYCELAAFEILNEHVWRSEYPFERAMQLEVDVSSRRTFCQRQGGTINIDGYVDWTDTYFEIKALKDIGREMLDNICKDIRKRTGRSPNIAVDGYYETHYQTIEQNREQIINILIDKMANDAKPAYVTTKYGIAFRLKWDKPSVTHGVSLVDEYKIAEQLHQLVFVHHAQVLKRKPFIMVFVSSPLWNRFLNGFDDVRNSFYRAFARRVFCQYKRSRESLRPSVSKRSITTSIAGILFLEDGFVQRAEANNNVGTLFWNPNVKKSSRATLCEQHLRECKGIKLDWSLWGDNY